MELYSAAFKHGDLIPKKYTADGTDVSLPVTWFDAPLDTASFVLIASDPDAPDPKAPKMVFCHWTVWNIPADANHLEEDIPKTAQPEDTLEQGTNDFGNIGYGGPNPPVGVHRYMFKLYALNVMLNLPNTATKKELEAAIDGHVLDEALLMGRYGKS